MRTKKTELYVHLIWGVWGGEPALASLDEARLHEVISEIAAAMSVDALAAGGTETHLHVLARLPSTLPVDHWASHLKAASAQFVSKALGDERHFRWAAAYAAFSVSKTDLIGVTEYIRRQREIHSAGAEDAAMELE